MGCVSAVHARPSESVIKTSSTPPGGSFQKPHWDKKPDLDKLDLQNPDISASASTALSSTVDIDTASISLSLTTGSLVQEEQESDSDEMRQLLSLVEGTNRLAHLSTFAKEYCSRDFCGRLLRKCKGDVQKSAAMLEKALIWRQQHERLLTLREFKEAGDMRIIGSDKEGRPIIYQCARNQLLPGSQGFDQYVVRMLQAVDVMPAGVSTMTHIWDVHGMRIMLNLNPAAILALLRVFEAYFAERMHQLIVVDRPRSAQFLIDAVWPRLPESTRQKVVFLNFDATLLRLEESCRSDVFDRIRTVMHENRNPKLDLEHRRRAWSQ